MDGRDKRSEWGTMISNDSFAPSGLGREWVGGVRGLTPPG